MVFDGVTPRRQKAPRARRQQAPQDPAIMVRAALLRRSCADQLRRAHSARRVRDGADAAATEQMLRAALLRRSCDGVAALVREDDAVDHHLISPMLVGLAARLQHATPLERGELVYL